jgi:hypothetical protein
LLAEIAAATAKVGIAEMRLVLSMGRDKFCFVEVSNSSSATRFLSVQPKGRPTIKSIGQAASNGCVRMHNEDIVALFQQVTPETAVLVTP